MKNKAYRQTILTLSILTLLTMSLYLLWGSYHISFVDVVKTFMNQGSKFQNTTLIQIRLPRMIVAMLVAISLSTAGGILQTITKNELSDPGIIGINAGAATFAVIFISLTTTSYYSQLKGFSIYLLPTIAISGAFITMFVVYLLSGLNRFHPRRLLLIGLGINGGLNALIMFFMFKGGVGDFNRALIWTSGSLWGVGWLYVKVILPLVVIIYLIALLNHKKLDVLSLSDEHVVSLGLNIDKVRRYFLFISVLLAGVATAFAGNIGFLGLIAPNIAKRLVGNYHKEFLNVAALISIIITLLADAFARNLFSPIEIPVGIIISIIGVPYFIYLLLKEA